MFGVGVATSASDAADAGDEENLALDKRTTTGDAGARNASQTVNDRDVNTMVGALILECARNEAVRTCTVVACAVRPHFFSASKRK